MTRRQTFLLSLLLLIIVVLAFIRLGKQQEADQNNAYLDQLSKNTEKLRSENALLKQRILVEEALTTISSKAANLGFVTGTPLFLTK